jgi:hypothetical protein
MERVSLVSIQELVQAFHPCLTSRRRSLSEQYFENLEGTEKKGEEEGACREGQGGGARLNTFNTFNT